MRETAITALLVLASCAGFYLALEGAYSLSKGMKARRSLSFEFLGQRRVSPPDSGPMAGYLHTRQQLEARLPLFEQSGVVLGNSPYDELASAEARVTRDDPEVGVRFKPELSVRTGHLRSRLFKALDPLSYSYIVRADLQPAPELIRFLARYSLEEVSWTTDQEGFRTTVPAPPSSRQASAPPVVALIGSSPCVGLYLRDAETLASLLQQRDPSRRYVNACVNTTSVANHAAMAGDLAERFGDRLVGAIYTLNEKNFESADRALVAVDEIAERLDEVGADYRVLIYFHYIYETMPDLFRKHLQLEESFADKARIMARAGERGFHTIDSYTFVERYRVAQGSLFAGMQLYLDHGHLSREGTRLLADAVPALGPAGSSAPSGQGDR